MSDGILLPEVPRGTLLSVSQRLERCALARPQILSVLEGETDAIALQSSLACLLWHVFIQSNWCGFYRRVADDELAVGPYQGGMGCLRIPFSRGVCGAAARENKTQWVPDVHQFPGHIACDDATRSECVIPLRDHSGEVRGVLDLDSPHLSGFDPQEAAFCENLLQEIFSRPVRW